MSSTRPYPVGCYCYTCDKSFGRPSQLRRHLKMTLVHNSGARAHHCPHCNKGFTQKSNISEHIRAVHGLIPEGSNSRSRGKTAIRHRSETSPSPGLGKRPVRENARRRQVLSEASRIVTLPTVPTMFVPFSKEAPSVNVFSLVTLQTIYSENVNSECEIPDFKGGSAVIDDSMCISTFSSEAASPSPSCDYIPGPSSFVPSSSIPSTNPIHIMSPEDLETNGMEEQVRSYFADLEARLGIPGLIAAFPYPSSVNAVAEPNLGEGSSRLPHMFNNVNGPFSPGPSNYQTRQLPLLPSTSSSLLLNWFQAIEVQRRNNDLQYYEQRYGFGSLLEDQFPNDHLTAHNGTVRPQEIEQRPQEQQPQQLDQWSPIFSDHLSMALSDYSTDDWYSGYTPTPESGLCGSLEINSSE